MGGVPGNVAQAKHADGPFGVELVNGVDPELMALPAPTDGLRLFSMGSMALTVGVALALLLSLRSDIGYWFSSDAAVQLGEARALGSDALPENRYVTVQGTPMASGMVRAERALGGGVLLFPLAGQRRVYVLMDAQDGPEGDLSRREYSGRLVAFSALGSRAEALQRGLAEHGFPVGPATYVLMADQAPGSGYRELTLALLALLFVLVNAFLMWRWFSPRFRSIEGVA